MQISKMQKRILETFLSKILFSQLLTYGNTIFQKQSVEKSRLDFFSKKLDLKNLTASEFKQAQKSFRKTIQFFNFQFMAFKIIYFFNCT